MKPRNLFLIAALSLAFLFVFARTASVQAHEVKPETSTPAPGIALGESPAEVVLVFAEELTEEGSSLQVYNAAGTAIQISGGGVDLNDPQHATLRAGLPVLAEGVYQVKWSIVLTDGDGSSGSYHFGVGKVVVPSQAAEESGAAPAEAAAGQSQSGLPTALWIVLVVLLVGAGGVILLLKKNK